MMQKSLILSITTLLTILTAPFDNSQQNKDNKNILILFAYASDGPAYRRILKGIEEEIANQVGSNYTLQAEYLDIAHYPQWDYPKEVFDKYNEKYREINLDLLICVGVGIIDPVKKNADDYLLSLPTVVLDLDFSNFGYETDFHLNNKTAVLPLKFNIDKTFSTALSLFPEATSISFISGTSRLDKFLALVTKEAAGKILGNKKITFDTDLSMNETLQLVKKLPDSTIIFIPYYTTDSKLVPYHNTEAIRLIRIEANAPIFHLSDLGLGEGAVGGYIMNFAKAGSLTGKVAVKILDGTDPNSIKISESDYYDYAFDWRELKRWNLENSDLIPEESIILFKEFNFLYEYKWILGAIILFLVLQSMMIVNLIRLNRNQKLMTKKVIETENRYREFLHEDRSLRLGQLTASLSHELNQPLTAILSTAQAGINFIDSNEATPELLKQIFQKIVENDKRGASILSSIRGMMKLESREKEKVNLNSLIDEVTSVYRNEASLRNIKLIVNLTDEPVYIFADGIQIQQVLLNLIFNASQSMGKINASKKVITISDSINNTNVIVSVSDRGTGIDEAEKDKLFKPFITAKKEGTGIGLVICRSIIEDHEGKIWAENIPDGGAKFSFSLKIIKDE
ncbi:MAG: sensor histidine kinase [Ignavibacteriaceae bacterium]|nr:sensor histidine kinase [Ignavibacteriaceae bacterium]